MSYTGRGGAVNDLVLLDNLSEDTIVDCLQNHHSNREIYTYIGPVLISVNPYTNINGLYGPNKIKKFVLKKEYENNPHVYAIAERAYRAMVNDLSNECVVITGESGSGKTEASKKVMEYIAAMNTSGNKSKEVQRVKNQLLKSNPLLESFGNAKTVRNDNSSRFGKYMEILFLVGDPAGGKITTYLLEKSRVVGQQPGERNFHVFYEILNDKSYSRRFNLDPRDEYSYISDPTSNVVDTIDDVGNFEDTQGAMEYIGVSKQEQEEIFSIVGFLLHLGNCEMKGKTIVNQDALKSAADLISVKPKALEMAITHRTVKSGIEQVTTPLNRDDAKNARDSMAKSVYNKLFDYVVRRANEAITCDKFSTSIGVLDIYGFEILGVNGFEQLCINYTNEKLHQLFIELTLKAEQEEYRREGIQWEEIKYFNNKPIVDMIESKRGFFDILNDESNFPKGSDKSLYNKLQQQLKNREFQVPPRSQDLEFQITHYAGGVRYSVLNFVETNKDKLFPDIVQCISSSSNSVAKNLFKGHQAARKSTKVFKKAPTTCTQYRINVQELMTDLARCNQHYIRCIKPNEQKAASMFQEDLVRTQCRYLGLLEGVRVRRAGYAFRMSYDRFAAKYKCVLNDNALSAGFNPDSRSVTEQILNANVKGKSGFEFGKSKIFIKQASSILQIEEKRKKFLQTSKDLLPPDEDGLMFADKVLGVNNKFVKLSLTFCVGGQGFYWYNSDGSVAQFFPMEKIDRIGYNDKEGWMTIHSNYPSKEEGQVVNLTYLSENIYGANVENFAEVLHSMGYERIQANKAGAIPLDATDIEEYKALVKNIAKGEKPTAQRGKAPTESSGCCVIS